MFAGPGSCAKGVHNGGRAGWRAPCAAPWGSCVWGKRWVRGGGSGGSGGSGGDFHGISPLFWWWFNGWLTMVDITDMIYPPVVTNSQLLKPWPQKWWVFAVTAWWFSIVRWLFTRGYLFPCRKHANITRIAMGQVPHVPRPIRISSMTSDAVKLWPPGVSMQRTNKPWRCDRRCRTWKNQPWRAVKSTIGGCFKGKPIYKYLGVLVLAVWRSHQLAVLSCVGMTMVGWQRWVTSPQEDLA